MTQDPENSLVPTPRIRATSNGTPRVSMGFDLVKQWEETANEKKKAAFAFNHLWVMAQHEQGEVLQGLIHNDKAFIRKLKFQRTMDDATSSDK
ncbi:hypothetical protein ABIC49_001426 [Burkholderia ambifaria]